MSQLIAAQPIAIPLTDMERMAVALAKSGLFSIKTPDQALALMLLAQAEGRHPVSVARDYQIIQGRPSLTADAMLARFQAAGGSVRWETLTDERVAATFSHPQGGEARIEWDMERAKTAGLTGKDNWRKFPRQMLRARVTSEGVRTVYPGATSGMYVPEEVIDFDRPEARVTVEEPVRVVAEALPEPERIAPPEQPTVDLKTRATRALEALDSAAPSKVNKLLPRAEAVCAELIEAGMQSSAAMLRQAIEEAKARAAETVGAFE